MGSKMFYLRSIFLFIFVLSITIPLTASRSTNILSHISHIESRLQNALGFGASQSTSTSLASLPTSSVEFLDNICQYKNTSLIPLSGETFYSFHNSSTLRHFSLTFCATSQEEECAKSNGSICAYDTKANTLISSMGSFLAPDLPLEYSYLDPDQPQSGLNVHFASKQGCPDQEFFNFPVNVTLNLRCAKHQSKYITVVQSTTCLYHAQFDTPAACSLVPPHPHHEGSNHLLLIVVIFILCLFAYFVIGMIVNVVLYGANCGSDAIPQRAFWLSLPLWFFSGLVFVINKIRSLFGCNNATIVTSHGEYDTV